MHTEIETAGGKFVLGKDVVNMDLDMLSLSQSNIQVETDSRKVEMECWRISHVVDLASVSPEVTAEDLGEFEFPKGEKKS